MTIMGRVIDAISKEAQNAPDGPRAFQLELVMRSGAVVRGDLVESVIGKGFLELHQTKADPKEHAMFIAHEAIDLVRVIWL